MKTRAIPGLGGKLRIRLVNASKPPAEAPTATIGNLPLLRSPGAAPVWPLCGRERVTSFFMTVLVPSCDGHIIGRSPESSNHPHSGTGVHSLPSPFHFIISFEPRVCPCCREKPYSDALSPTKQPSHSRTIGALWRTPCCRSTC